jgi:hypothetical protein
VLLEHFFFLSVVFYFYRLAMAITIDAVQKALAFTKAGANIIFLMDKKGVDEDVQAKLYHIGVVSVELFSVFAKDQADLEDILKDNFGLDPTDLMSRVPASKVVVAWMAAKARATKQAELDGECEARKVPKDIGTSDITAMRKAFEKAWWTLEDSLVPAKTYLEKKLDEVEKDELRAEMLTEVLTVPEDDPDTLKTIWTSNNELKAVKVGAKVALPKDPEEFRKRITVLGTAWMFVAFQQTHKPYLKGLTPQCFTEYLTYMLGEHVMGLGAKDSAGNLMAYPPWSLVISYEHAVRSKAISLVKKGAIFKDALREAWEDPLTKERNFTTPLCLESGRKRSADFSSSSSPYQPPTKIAHKGKSKGSGKSSGKGKGKGKTPGCAARTPEPDSKLICYKFNKEAQRCSSAAKCRFAHVCGVCYKKDTPMYQCNHQK